MHAYMNFMSFIRPESLTIRVSKLYPVITRSGMDLSPGSIYFIDHFIAIFPHWVLGWVGK